MGPVHVQRCSGSFIRSLKFHVICMPAVSSTQPRPWIKVVERTSLESLPMMCPSEWDPQLHLEAHLFSQMSRSMYTNADQTGSQDRPCDQYSIPILVLLCRLVEPWSKPGPDWLKSGDLPWPWFMHYHGMTCTAAGHPLGSEDPEVKTKCFSQVAQFDAFGPLSKPGPDWSQCGG